MVCSTVLLVLSRLFSFLWLVYRCFTPSPRPLTASSPAIDLHDPSPGRLLRQLDCSGPEPVVQFVVDASTAGIASLVQRQKGSKKKAPPRRPTGYVPRAGYGASKSPDYAPLSGEILVYSDKTP